MRRKLVFLLYRAVSLASFPFIVLYALRRVATDRRYFATLKERFGWLPSPLRQTVAGGIWIHAVSVGEVISAEPLILRIREKLSRAPVYLSVTTLAGRHVAQDRLESLVDGVFFAPIDYAWVVRRVLRRLRPSLLIVLETEIWPNLWREAKRSGARLIVVNGRISDRAWPTYRRWRWFFATVLDEADVILPQSEVSRVRFAEIVGGDGKLAATGNLKYDFVEKRAPEAVTSLLERLQPAHVWIAASTMAPAYSGDCDEQDAVMDAFQELAPGFPGLLLIVAPRKPEHFDMVGERLALRGIRFLRRSRLSGGDALELPAVLLLDSIGELSGTFETATVVFMGGTLANRGGHNLLEPAFYEKAVICGPHMENFPEIAIEFREERALLEIGGAGEIAGAVARLLVDDALRKDLGARAGRLARAKAGAPERAAVEAMRWIEEAAPRTARNAVSEWLLRPLAAIWCAGVSWRRRRDSAASRRLPVPVVSIGGVTMGGAGKTPFAIWLAAELRKRGHTPGILTRGYGRRDATEVAVVGVGEAADTALTGDEGQLLVRSAAGPVGIAADRYEAGVAVLKRFAVDAFVLDDGFQHWRLARDLDIVLLDALSPFGGGNLFSAGWLREDLAALARAHAIVLTRTEVGRSYRAIIEEIRRHNGSAPVFRSSVVAQEWREVGGAGRKTVGEMKQERTAMFCGLGNPDSFRTTLREVGVEPLACTLFRDHHRYRAAEIERICAEANTLGAGLLVTTGKDAMNLPRGYVAPLPIWQLNIEVAVEEGERLMDLVAACLNAAAVR